MRNKFQSVVSLVQITLIFIWQFWKELDCAAVFFPWYSTQKIMENFIQSRGFPKSIPPFIVRSREEKNKIDQVKNEKNLSVYKKFKKCAILACVTGVFPVQNCLSANSANSLVFKKCSFVFVYRFVCNLWSILIFKIMNLKSRHLVLF